MDDAYIEKLYSDMTALYHLDQIGNAKGISAERMELGKLPKTAVLLLTGLVTVWILILGYAGIKWAKKKHNSRARY